MSVRLPNPDPGRSAAEGYVAKHLDGLFGDSATGSIRFHGGQKAADAQLARFNVTDYADRRNEVAPHSKRATSGLSPYLRHGLLSLQEVWDHVEGGPELDVEAFRDELLEQEYSRHWYARLGERTGTGIRYELEASDRRFEWDTTMACVDLNIGELEEEGWLVNQARLWLASQMVVRENGSWQRGEDYFFTHLLDGSRATNRLGWQSTIGTAASRVYSFSRWQVEKRAAGLCASCDRVHECPIESWPMEPQYTRAETPVELDGDPDLERTRGPLAPAVIDEVKSVWLTAESLGLDDPALAANPDVPVIFVMDQALLQRLQLSAKRLVFLVETLAELTLSRQVEVWLGDPAGVVRGRGAATTFAPVPGFRRIAPQAELSALYPYRWLRTPKGGTVATAEAWKRESNSTELRDSAVSVE